MAENKVKQPYRLPIEQCQERLAKMPAVEVHWNMSANGKYIIVQTIISEIKPLAFVEAVLRQQPKQAESKQEA